MKEYKIVVAHPYKQHSFELAEALREKKYLFKYVTTVYYKKYNLTWFIGQFFRGGMRKKVISRHDNRINDYVIQFCEFLGLLKLLTLRVKFLKKYYISLKYKSSDIFSRKVAKYCMNNNVDAVVLYDDTSPECSKILKKRNSNIKIILDMSAPALPYMKKIYEEDMIVSPDFSDMLKNEKINTFNEKLLKRLNEEIKYADYFLVASEFTKQSLIECNVPENRIFICRYGINSKVFKPGYKKNTILKAVYIGGTKQFKGLSYLLKAFKKLENYPVCLTIIGENTLSLEKQKEYKNIKFSGIILPERVSDILKDSDISIFPSLGDGFGFAVTESLSAGCPVICSKNTGASDLIIDGKNGFIIDIQNSEQIIEKVIYFIKNKSKLYEMQKEARNSVLQLSWENYYEDVSMAFNRIFKRNKKIDK